MRIIKASVSLEGDVSQDEIMKHIEKAGRVCYKSEDKISEVSADTFIKSILKRGHESVIEHACLTFKIICDRGVSHEIVRHRIASYSQESTRYCNYSHNKFGNELTFIEPYFWDKSKKQYEIWKDTMSIVEKRYFDLIQLGASPEEVRSILPNSIKTEIYVTMNLREWRHFLRLRTSRGAHPQMREVSLSIHKILIEKLPVFFEDIVIES